MFFYSSIVQVCLAAMIEQPSCADAAKVGVACSPAVQPEGDDDQEAQQP